LSDGTHLASSLCTRGRQSQAQPSQPMKSRMTARVEASAASPLEPGSLLLPTGGRLWARITGSELRSDVTYYTIAVRTAEAAEGESSRVVSQRYLQWEALDERLRRVVAEPGVPALPTGGMFSRFRRNVPAVVAQRRIELDAWLAAVFEALPRCRVMSAEAPASAPVTAAGGGPRPPWVAPLLAFLGPEVEGTCAAGDLAGAAGCGGGPPGRRAGAPALELPGPAANMDVFRPRRACAHHRARYMDSGTALPAAACRLDRGAVGLGDCTPPSCRSGRRDG